MVGSREKLGTKIYQQLSNTTKSEKIIKETQGDAFKMRSLQNNQSLPRKSSLLTLTPILIKGIL